MKTYTRTLESTKKLMRSIAKQEGVKLTFLKANEGMGGYNYGGSTGNTIMLSPFVKAKMGDKVKGHGIHSNCDNPIESMLIAFFHELSHCVLSKRVPSQVEGYAWNDTSKYQYELWITMLGVEYAHSKYGIKFSDQTMTWIVDEAKSYIPVDRDCGTGLICTKSNSKSYTVVSQWEFRGKKEEKNTKNRRKKAT